MRSTLDNPKNIPFFLVRMQKKYEKIKKKKLALKRNYTLLIK